jgi:ubiquinone/menaquinone biosynthesis C-methylase UbiE
MLGRARARRPDAAGRRPSLLIADAHALPIRADAVDVLVSAFVLDLLPADDLPPVLAEFRRVLRPGGRVALATMAFGDRWYHRAWGSIAAHAPRLLTGCRPVRVAPALRAAGFERIVAEPISQNTFPSEVLVASRPAR